MAAPRKYPDQLRERSVRLVFESGWPIAHVARDLGVHKEALTTNEVRWASVSYRERGGALYSWVSQ
jgi:transposase